MTTLILIAAFGFSQALAEDTAIVVKKGAGKYLETPDYEVVTETDDVAGDPAPGLKGSYASWKQACADWKKEIREQVKDQDGAKLLSVNCGKAVAEKQPDTTYVQSSKATYKMRVKTRDTGKKE